MKLGSPYGNSDRGSKYPFDEKSKFVSVVPGTPEAGKIPCDLFRVALFDMKDDDVSVSIQSVSSGGIAFLVSRPGAGDEHFVVSRDSLDEHGRFFFSSRRLFARLESRYVGDDFDAVVNQISGGADFEFPEPVGFDSSCTTRSAKKLESFQVGNSIVAGDVALRGGYNVDLQLSRDGSAIEVRCGSGLGDGLVPCTGGPVESQGIVGVVPDADGAVRIETDGCYSVCPVSDNVLQILGHCVACCSCDGDYLPVAKAVDNLIQRVAGSPETEGDTGGLYGELTRLNESYSRIVEDARDFLSRTVAAPEISMFYAEKSVLNDNADMYEIRVTLGFANRYSDSIRVRSISVSAGGKMLATTSAVPVIHTDDSSISAATADGGLAELSRSLQCDSVHFNDEDAVIDTVAGVELEQSKFMYFSTILRANNSIPETPGRIVFLSDFVELSVSYSYETEDSGTKRETLKKRVNWGDQE